MRKQGRLVIISHTPHFYDKGISYGWGPTVREINHLADSFEEVVHFAPLHKGPVPSGNMPYARTNVKYVRLFEAGGSKITDKIKLFFLSPINVFIILKRLRRTDWIQLRAPSNIALVMLPVFSILRFYNKWVKYAGNWNEKSPAFTYKIQRWWLKKNIGKCFVTVNGKWENEGSHILAFENPCIDEEELVDSNVASAAKKYDDPISLCFVGQLDENKGVLNLVNAIEEVRGENKTKIKELIIVGDGPMMNTLKERKQSSSVNINLVGYLNRDDINDIYKKAHVNILPSKSEGFPKVIAEGAAWGCIPVVTDMSSLSQYINQHNGFLLPDNSSDKILDALSRILNKNAEERRLIAANAVKMADKFTYKYYIDRLFSEIINAN